MFRSTMEGAGTSMPAIGLSLVPTSPMPPAAPRDAKSQPRADPLAQAQAGEGGVALTDRKAEVAPPAEARITAAIGRYGEQVAEALATRAFLRDDQAALRVSALGAPLAALLRDHPAARARDWLTPALQATANLHPTHREAALQQVLRPALSSTLGRVLFQAALDSIARGLQGADAPARRCTFAVLVKLVAMPHRDPADALALLESAQGYRTGIAYDDAALLVSAALRRLPQRPVPAMEPVACAALALLDADNQVAADQEPVLILGIELGRQARSTADPGRFQVLLEGVEAVAPGLRPEQLAELARGCLAGLGGTQVEPAQRDAWIATALGLRGALTVPALHGLWQGTGLGLLVDGAPGAGASGGANGGDARGGTDVSRLRSAHQGALVDAAVERAGEPEAVAAILAGAAAASNKRDEGPGTLADLLQRVGAAQSRLSTPAAFTAGCALARACWQLKEGAQAWAQARAAAGIGPGAQPGSGERETKGSAPPDPVGVGWRFATEPDTLAREPALPGLDPAEQARLAWSLPAMPPGSALPRHLRWLALAPLGPGPRVSLLVQLLDGLEGHAFQAVFTQVRDILVQACAEADAGPKTGHRPLLLRAMTALMLAYDRWLTDPRPQDRQAVRAQLAQVSAREDLLPSLRLMVIDRLSVHLAPPGEPVEGKAPGEPAKEGTGTPASRADAKS